MLTGAQTFFLGAPFVPIKIQRNLEHGWGRFARVMVGSFGAPFFGTCSFSRLGAGGSARRGQDSQTPSQQYLRFLPIMRRRTAAMRMKMLRRSAQNWLRNNDSLAPPLDVFSYMFVSLGMATTCTSLHAINILISSKPAPAVSQTPKTIQTSSLFVAWNILCNGVVRSGGRRKPGHIRHLQTPLSGPTQNYPSKAP